MTRLRLWLARLLLPRGWLPARYENLAWLCQIAFDAGVSGPDDLAAYAARPRTVKSLAIPLVTANADRKEPK